MRIWTYKNADEKAHTFSQRNKNVKKLTKTDEKRILCKFTLRPTTVIRKVTGLPETSFTLWKMIQQKQISMETTELMGLNSDALGLGVDSYAVLNTAMR